LLGILQVSSGKQIEKYKLGDGKTIRNEEKTSLVGQKSQFLLEWLSCSMTFCCFIVAAVNGGSLIQFLLTTSERASDGERSKFAHRVRGQNAKVDRRKQKIISNYIRLA
jgi:hypothetical protein